MRVPAGWRVTLYQHDGFEGITRVFHGGDIGYVGDAINDRTSSILVEEPAVLYEHSQYRGRSSALWPGYYTTQELGIADNSISSVRVPEGWEVRLYDSTWSNRVGTFGASTSYVGDAANDRASRVSVHRVPTVFRLPAIPALPALPLAP